jgi:hypothetical protein
MPVSRGIIIPGSVAQIRFPRNLTTARRGLTPVPPPTSGTLHSLTRALRNWPRGQPRSPYTPSAGARACVATRRSLARPRRSCACRRTGERDREVEAGQLVQRTLARMAARFPRARTLASGRLGNIGADFRHRSSCRKVRGLVDRDRGGNRRPTGITPTQNTGVGSSRMTDFTTQKSGSATTHRCPLSGCWPSGRAPR